MLPPLPLLWHMTSYPRADDRYTNNIPKTIPPPPPETGREETAALNANLQRNGAVAAGRVSRDCHAAPLVASGSRASDAREGRERVATAVGKITTEAVGRVRVRLEHARQQR